MSEHRFEYNPLAAKDMVIDQLMSKLEGKASIVTGNDPMSLLIESNVVTGVGLAEGLESVLQQIHPKLAKTRQDLYRHMDENDYEGVFSTPAYLPELNMLLKRSDVERLALKVPGTNIRKIVIPRFTRVSVSGTTFMLDNDIEIRLLSHGAINVLYLDNDTPFFTRESNEVDWYETVLNEERYLVLGVDMWQLDFNTKVMQLNPTQGLTSSFLIPAQYYTIRARYQSGNEWHDMEITHSEKHYDVAKPTLIVKVDGERIETRLPGIYYNSGLVTGRIEVTTFYTKGAMTLQLGTFQPRAYTIAYNFQTENPELNRYVSPLNKNLTLLMFSNSLVSGGSNETAFEDLRNSVIERRLGATLTPITTRQLRNEAAKKGYAVKLNVDNVTNRTFFLSRPIPKPSEMLDMGLIGTRLGFSDRVNARIARVYNTFEEYRKVRGVYDNIQRLTITTDARFMESGGVVRTLTDQERSEIDLLETNEERVLFFNRRRVLFTPFDYVIDVTTPHFESRAYYLKEPNFYGKELRGVNDTMEFDCTIERYDIERVPEGYRIAIGCKVGSNVRAAGLNALKAQASIDILNTDIKAYQNLEFKGIDPDDDLYVFMGTIESSFDIDNNDLIYLDSFRMSTGADSLQQPLDTKISIAFAISNHVDPNYKPYKNDIYYNGNIGDPSASVFNVETLLLSFGERLKHLYSGTDVAQSQAVYAVHETDKVWTYPTNVPERDENGDPKLELNPLTDKYEMVWKHLAGDPIVSESGEPQYAHRAGDIKLDENGQKILVRDRSVLYGVDLFLVDYKFYLADDEDVREYWVQVPKLLRTWINEDIDQFSTRLLENTDLFMYPNTNVGQIVVNSDNGRYLHIDAEQAIQVKVYMDSKNHQNEAIKETIRNSIKEILATRITDQVISKSDIVEDIRQENSDYILDVAVTGLGGKLNNFDIMTILDSTERLALKKKLVLRPDGVITIEDDVLIDIVKHDSTQT